MLRVVASLKKCGVAKGEAGSGLEGGVGKLWEKVVGLGNAPGVPTLDVATPIPSKEKGYGGIETGEMLPVYGLGWTPPVPVNVKPPLDAGVKIAGEYGVAAVYEPADGFWPDVWL
jgi:hypothetical protein